MCGKIVRLDRLSNPADGALACLVAAAHPTILLHASTGPNSTSSPSLSTSNSSVTVTTPTTPSQSGHHGMSKKSYRALLEQLTLILKAYFVR